MPWWVLPLVVFAVWLVAAVAAVAHKAVTEARRGIPPDRRGGVSLLPVIPIGPLGCYGVALLADVIARPCGTVVVGGLHVVWGLWSVGAIVRDVRHLRALGG